jgi:hypothetical protein
MTDKSVWFDYKYTIIFKKRTKKTNKIAMHVKRGAVVRSFNTEYMYYLIFDFSLCFWCHVRLKQYIKNICFVVEAMNNILGPVHFSKNIYILFLC